MKTILLVLLSFLLVLPASAQDYMPLSPGNFWSYTGDNGWGDVRIVGEMVPLSGSMVYPIGHPDLDPFLNLVNYWSTGPDGDLLLWGWSRGTFGYLYQPPIVVADSPLAVGKEWTTTVDLYAVTDSSYVETREFPYVVYDHADIEVPAGIFDCWGVGYGPSTTKVLFDGRYNIMGEDVGSEIYAGAGDVERWYAEDVGIVEEYVWTVLKLETYTSHPVAIEAATWDGVKALFRDHK